MPSLQVGQTQIAYVTRRSPRAKRRRIIVKPDQVEVVVPMGQTDESVADFVQRRREWIYTKQEQLRERAERQQKVGPTRMVTGAKIPYRGRMMRLYVDRGSVDEVAVEYRNGFQVTAPKTADDDDIRTAIEAWLKTRVTRDVRGFIARYAPRLGVTPEAVRVMALQRVWGSCGPGGVIHVNWKLIFAPKAVLEYAVVHELVHLRHRDHSIDFWTTVGSLTPDYALRKTWLENNEDLLEARDLTRAKPLKTKPTFHYHLELTNNLHRPFQFHFNWKEPPEAKLVVGTATHPRRCVWCGGTKPTARFRSVAHVIPEALGNKWLVSAEECDDCNRALGHAIDDGFVKALAPFRTTLAVKGKKGRRAKLRFPGSDAYIDTAVPGAEMSVMSPGDSESPIAIVGPNKAIVSVPIEKHAPITIPKGLARMAVLVCPELRTAEYTALQQWVRGTRSILPVTYWSAIRPGGGAVNVSLAVCEHRGWAMLNTPRWFVVFSLTHVIFVFHLLSDTEWCCGSRNWVLPNFHASHFGADSKRQFSWTCTEVRTDDKIQAHYRDLHVSFDKRETVPVEAPETDARS